MKRNCILLLNLLFVSYSYCLFEGGYSFSSDSKIPSLKQLISSVCNKPYDLHLKEFEEAFLLVEEYEQNITCRVSSEWIGGGQL